MRPGAQSIDLAKLIRIGGYWLVVHRIDLPIASAFASSLVLTLLGTLSVFAVEYRRLQYSAIPLKPKYLTKE